MARNNLQVVFNWKENPQTSREANHLFSVLMDQARHKRYGNIKIVACPPFVYLSEFFKKHVRNARPSLGAQDVFWENGGAYTGEIGPAILKQFGVTHVIIGHSERRRWFCETDEMVNKKVRSALEGGMRVVLCVGEPEKIRKIGKMAARQYVKTQLKKDLQNVKNSKLKSKNLVVAYEPIWAIGTGRNCPPADARDMAAFIKKETHGAMVLYGGSVDGANVASYVCYHEIRGVLVGGASLRAEEIKKIMKAIS